MAGEGLGWGAGGLAAGEADLRTQQTHMLDMATGGVKLEEAKIQLEQQKRFLDMLAKRQAASGGSGGLSADPAEELYQIGQMYLDSEQVDKGREAFSTASLMQQHSSTITKNQLDGVIKESTIMGSLMEGVHDPMSWEAANAEFQRQTGQKSPYAGKPYNPMMVEKLKEGIATRKDKAITALDQLRAKDVAAETKEREARVPLIKAETKLAETRERVLKKGGGGRLVPTDKDLKLITDQVAQDYHVRSAEEVRVLSRPVAEEALRLRAENPGMTASEAATVAYQDAKRRAVYAAMGKPKPVIPGRSPAKPMDLPADKKDLRENTWYTVKGKPMYFVDKEFVSDESKEE